MIRIINSVYGKVCGNLVKPVYPGDPPFSLSAEREKELVECGVAEYVSDASTAANLEYEKEEYVNSLSESEDFLTQMKKKELIDYAESIGLSVSPLDKKEDLIEQIRAEERNDAPPTFSAESAMQ